MLYTRFLDLLRRIFKKNKEEDHSAECPYFVEVSDRENNLHDR